MAAVPQSSRELSLRVRVSRLGVASWTVLDDDLRAPPAAHRRACPQGQPSRRRTPICRIETAAGPNRLCVEAHRGPIRLLPYRNASNQLRAWTCPARSYVGTHVQQREQRNTGDGSFHSPKATCVSTRYDAAVPGRTWRLSITEAESEELLLGMPNLRRGRHAGVRPTRRPSAYETDTRRRHGRLQTDLTCSRWTPRRYRQLQTDSEGSPG